MVLYFSLSKPNPGPFNKKLETETSNLLNSLTTKVSSVRSIEPEIKRKVDLKGL